MQTSVESYFYGFVRYWQLSGHAIGTASSASGNRAPARPALMAYCRYYGAMRDTASKVPAAAVRGRARTVSSLLA